MIDHVQVGSPRRAQIRTAILVMPFGLISFPDIGVSSLKAWFQQHGYPLDIKYCNLDFAHRIGIREYEFYMNVCNPTLASEYPFAKELNQELPDFEEFLRMIMPANFGRKLGAVRGLYHEMLFRMDKLAKHAKQYLDELEESLDLSEYKVIGFTTSFAQNSASWAFAKRLRRRYPDAVIIIGGANCEGEMGKAQIDAFDFIDYVCVGEGEIPFLELVRWLEDPEHNGFPESGIVSRHNDNRADRTRLMDMSRLPVPDYQDYFEALNRYPDWPYWYYGLPMESSRGCWWGQKNQCVFCGCNGTRLGFRQKSAEQFARELDEMRSRYGDKARHVQVVDNIMPHDYLDRFVSLMRKERPYETLFYEVKANLRPEHVRGLRDIGATFLQPGVESLSTPILKLMRKGVTAIGNVQTLKYAEQYGVRLVWSVLCGLPGEKPEHYDEMAGLLCKLYHLPPPRGLAEITFDRHSPLQQNSLAYGLRLKPALAYKILYGLSDEILSDLAYWFEDDSKASGRIRYYQLPDYVKSCQRRIQIWRARYYGNSPARFDYEILGDAMQITDTRSDENGVQITLDGTRKLIVEATASIASLEHIVSRVRGIDSGISEREIRNELEEMTDASLIMRENKRYLFLGLDRNELEKRPDSNFWLEKVNRGESYQFA